MHTPNRLAQLRRTVDGLLKTAHQSMQRGDYLAAESSCKQALNEWRRASAPRSDESNIVTALGKCYEAQRKYELASELYMEVLPHFTGAAYDEVYNQLLYLNERMGTFHNKKDDN